MSAALHDLSYVQAGLEHSFLEILLFLQILEIYLAGLQNDLFEFQLLYRVEL